MEYQHNFTLVYGVNLNCTLVDFSVKATIDRYKKASSDSTNTGSTSEANTQVHFSFSSCRDMT